MLFPQNPHLKQAHALPSFNMTKTEKNNNAKSDVLLLLGTNTT
jgi:hypothetical protein